jgi:hypothetical protein
MDGILDSLADFMSPTDPPVKITPRQQWELDEMAASRRYTRDQITARRFALEAESLYSNMHDPWALQYAHDAMKLDPLCCDAYRVFFRNVQIAPSLDGDSLLCLYRSLLFFFRDSVWLQLIREHPGDAHKSFELQPYLRLLECISAACVASDKSEVSTRALEECIRSDHSDALGVRDYLLLNYLTAIGRSRVPKAVLIDRTMDDLHELLHHVLPGQTRPLFELNKRSSWGLRWLSIIDGQQTDSKSWTKLARDEWGRDRILIAAVFEQSQAESVPEARAVRRRADAVRAVLGEFPFVYRRFCELTNGPTSHLNCNRLFVGFSRTSRAQAAKVAYDLLDEGRATLRASDHHGTVEMLGSSKRQFQDTIRPSQRWYLNAPFSVVSNRATAAEKLTAWPITLHDVRFTLLLQPDHVRSYEKIPWIAAELFAPDSHLKMLRDFVAEVKRDPKRNMKQWRALAARAIALCSMPALILARLGKLTPEKIDELVRVGIDDMYTPVNVDADVLPLLPWLTEEDLDQMQ